MSAWATWDNRQRTFWIVVATVAVVSIAYALDIRYLILGQRGVTAVDDIGEAVAAAIAAGASAWAFGLKSVWLSNSSTRILDLAYPVSDILIGTILILAIRRASQQQAGRMAFLLAGVASYSIADSAFAYLNAQGAFGAVGNVIDTGWFAGF